MQKTLVTATKKAIDGKLTLIVSDGFRIKVLEADAAKCGYRSRFTLVHRPHG